MRFPNTPERREKWEIGPRKHQEMKTIVVKEGSRNIINEAFRVLRSNLDFMASKDSSQNVFVLTSFNPSSGKSFLTMNHSHKFRHQKEKGTDYRRRLAARLHFFLH